MLAGDSPAVRCGFQAPQRWPPFAPHHAMRSLLEQAGPVRQLLCAPGPDVPGPSLLARHGWSGRLATLIGVRRLEFDRITTSRLVRRAFPDTVWCRVVEVFTKLRTCYGVIHKVSAVNVGVMASFLHAMTFA